MFEKRPIERQMSLASVAVSVATVARFDRRWTRDAHVWVTSECLLAAATVSSHCVSSKSALVMPSRLELRLVIASQKHIQRSTELRSRRVAAVVSATSMHAFEKSTRNSVTAAAAAATQRLCSPPVGVCMRVLGCRGACTLAQRGKRREEERERGCEQKENPKLRRREMMARADDVDVNDERTKRRRK